MPFLSSQVISEKAKRPSTDVTKSQVAKKSAAITPEANEVEHFRTKVREANAQATDFLRTVQCRTILDKPFLSLDFFETIFSNFKSSCDCSKLMQIFEDEVRKNFLFDGWSISHVSVDAANVLLTFFGREPELLFAATSQLSKIPFVRLSNVLPKSFPGTPSVGSDPMTPGSFRTSKRPKLATEKFQNSNFLSRGRLMASLLSPEKSDSTNSTQNVDLDSGRKVSADVKPRLRPKYRHLSQVPAPVPVASEARLSLPGGWRIETSNRNIEEFVSSSGDRLKIGPVKPSKLAESKAELIRRLDSQPEVRIYSDG